MLAHFSRRLLHEYLSSAFWAVFKKMRNGGGGGSLRNGMLELKSDFFLFDQRSRKKMNVFGRFKSLKCVNFKI